MFSYIKGTLSHIGTNHIVLDVGGVGFKIYTSQTSINGASSLSDKTDVTFHTYLYIKEGIMDLYGFYTKEELELFEMLISVSGVGAKGAIAILSVASYSKISLSIVTGDAKFISQAQGIGSKTAQRICLELKDKISNDAIIQSDDNSIETVVINVDARKEAVSALMALGYSKQMAEKAVLKADNSLDKVEDIIKSALKSLM